MNYLKFITAGIFLLSSNVIFNESSALANSGGCGSGRSWYALRVVSPIAVQQFDVACHEHDKCYETYGKPKQECDKAFHERMLGTCARDHNTILGRPLRALCNGKADAYYTGVMEHGQDAYDAAQNEHKPVGIPIPGDSQTNSYFIQRIGEHSEWLLTHTDHADLWNAILSAAKRDAKIN